MKKYTEIGIGNTWFIRTEFEDDTGLEREIKGFTKPFVLQSIYLRIWLGRKVIIIDSKEGLKITTKDRKKLKILIGLLGL
ncbi:DUF3977 family protein [Paenibacillus macquariensis]|uniref:DUF3977 domain-containing protein n=1 Tax=Paenibacillus macquariensis TaxID=948756 RepID=A0ABY1JMJ8_9BACL|nr:DUF3977 family protein [Paenibacillus macquariensis]MEC0092324.1 DUF3977 family protein [Paenibacillus macquariensis]OAB37137.1 hypothetical protein PMSM_03400 [Paenibacillus macquariensis subsp. macquariensis]SIQ46179.1 Protein of unknown function [Paenibacillus macquariensis]